jgi:hypothetical protein
MAQALSNVTFEATSQHVGSNVVRVRVRDEASSFEYIQTCNVMWRFDFLYRFQCIYRSQAIKEILLYFYIRYIRYILRKIFLYFYVSNRHCI